MKNRRLLFTITKKDLIITYFSSKGPGGQNKNKHQNHVRIKHPDSGAIVTGQSHKERRANMKEALHNLPKNGKFKMWHTRKCAEIIKGETLDETVDKMMKEKNLKIEIRNKDGKWEDDKII